MLKITGRLIAKAVLLEGENSFGKWQLVQIIVEKKIKNIKNKYVFSCFGKVAIMANEIQLKERVTVLFDPACNYNEKYQRWFTELKAKEIGIYVKKPKFDWQQHNEQIEPKNHIQKDHQLSIILPNGTEKK